MGTQVAGGIVDQVSELISLYFLDLLSNKLSIKFKTSYEEIVDIKFDLTTKNSMNNNTLF